MLLHDKLSVISHIGKIEVEAHFSLSFGKVALCVLALEQRWSRTLGAARGLGGFRIWLGVMRDHFRLKKIAYRIW